LYKIGITNRSVRERFGRDFDKIFVLMEKTFNLGIAALEEGERILKEFRLDRYIGPNILASGNEELFVRDVLGLDE
jgi:hypothetical protein